VPPVCPTSGDEPGSPPRAAAASLAACGESKSKTADRRHSGGLKLKATAGLNPPVMGWSLIPDNLQPLQGNECR
jgi:hypothetical protein